MVELDALVALLQASPNPVPVLIKLYCKFFHMWTTSMDLNYYGDLLLVLENLRGILKGFEQAVIKT